jgi:hypothetical protein
VKNTDRIDRETQKEHRTAAKQRISVRSISGRYLWERSVTISWRSITHSNTARKKVLQMPILTTMRTMRAVCCGVY